MPLSDVLPKWEVAVESAVRTFAEAALPAFVASISLTRAEGVTVKDFVVAALISAGAAGVAAVARLFAPLKTDTQGVGVEGVSR